MERVHRIVLQRVHEVDANGLTNFELDRILVVVVVKGDGVYLVEVVRAVEIDVEAAHHHYHLAVDFGSSSLRVYDERAIKPFCNVLGERRGVAVIEVKSERLGVELVDIFAAWGNDARLCIENAVHVARMNSMKMDAVRVVTRVQKLDPDAITFVHPDCGAGDPTVIGPRGKLEPRHDLDDLILNDERVLVKDLPVWKRADFSGIEIGEERGRIEAVLDVVDLAIHGGHQRGMPVWTELGWSGVRAGRYALRLQRQSDRSRPDDASAADASRFDEVPAR